jgi:DNA-binding CsgD family transcriptional regulator
MGVVDDLLAARAKYEQRDWAAAYEGWSELDPATLSDADLAALATAAYLVGRHDACIDALQRCFQVRTESGAREAAVRCAFWLAHISMSTWQRAVGRGWTARARRLVDEVGPDTVEQGYVRVAEMFGHITSGEFEEVPGCAAEIIEYGRRFTDPDLLAMGLSTQGRTLLYMGQVPDGLARFDEAMVGIAAGEVSPIFAGDIYCSMIEACQEVCDFGRAAEWTAALSRWCDAQPGLIAFTGQCAVHRGQIMALRGSYAEAIEEFQAAQDRYLAAGTPVPAGIAAAERGDVLRLLGRYDEAEAAYEQASEFGHEPQPGLAVLWLERGRPEPAKAAAARLLAETPTGAARVRVLPAAVEIMTATGEPARAHDAARELDDIAQAFRCPPIAAMAAHALGRVELERGDPAGALPYLRKAMQLWTSIDCPYEVARVRVLIARACVALGDTESSQAHLDAARRTFAGLGAAPALDEVEQLSKPDGFPGGLTAREVEVLRLVAAGKSNAQIAAALTLSEKTVARHLSNIFAKIGARSRTAAAAYAFERGLT